MAVEYTLTFGQSSTEPYGVLHIEETGTSTTANTSTISYTLTLKRPYAISSSSTKTASVWIEGQTYTWSGSVGGSGDKTLISGTQTIAHNSDGSKVIDFSASIEFGSIYWSYTGRNLGTKSGSGKLTLSNIPRYPTVSQSVSSKTETTIKMAWSADSICDALWWSTDGGSTWSALQSINAKSGTYTITGLSDGQSYSVVTSVRRKDSQLYKNTSALSVKTYWYPYCTNFPNFTIGDTVTLGFYNPLGRTFNFDLQIANGGWIEGWTVSGKTSYTGLDGSSTISSLYASIPSAKSGTYKIRCRYGSASYTTSTAKYSVNEKQCAPTIGTCSYKDTNSTTVAVTGNDQNIVQNLSKVQYTASGLSAKNSASISSVKVRVNGSTYTLTRSGTTATGGNAVINSGSTVTATFTITDSRGLTASKNITVKMLAYSNPSAVITLWRESNYYTLSHIIVDATFANIGSNALRIRVWKRKHGTSDWGNASTLESGTEYDISADNNYQWDVLVQLDDTLGGLAIYNLTLPKGMPLIYFDRLKSSVGINCFPAGSETLEVSGIDVLAKVKNSMQWGENDQYWRITASEKWETGLVHSQGMTSDGSYIYLTHRSSGDDSTVMKIAKLNMNDSMQSVLDASISTGHFNMLDCYNGIIYASAGALTSGKADYTKVKVIKATDLSVISTKTLPNNWGVGVRQFFEKVGEDKVITYKTGYITALYVGSSRNINLYQSYIDSANKVQTPLAQITLDYTGCTTVQGSFHMTNNYIWLLETAYTNATRASGHQVIRCFSYSGMLVKSLYIDGITTELEDLYVEEGDPDDGTNNIIYVNDLNGTIYKFDVPRFYHTLPSNPATVYAMKAGTVKHVYAHPSALDSRYAFSGKYVYSQITVSDFMFKGEIGHFVPPVIYVNGADHVGAFSEDFNTITFEGNYTWGGGGTLTWIFTFSIKVNSSGNNYQYYLSNAKVRVHDDTGLNLYYNVNGTGDLTDTSDGTMGKMFSTLFSSSWFNSDIYIKGLSYVCGVGNTSTSLDLIGG